ncbi:hypothetical protein [Bacillus sp. MRMR6]|uniref:hypothetical protein n=1 Tax=Bacillus sp. MRMR6 TaxID=1928617 RepID=UPI000952C3FE|nr:hypothetical protein [Bacillus sp. MRMR6]OLS34728.1 hypothetical protein BTR25_21310 [Bacillus sp. MRMR6]
MGIRCSCGVSVPIAVAENQEVTFTDGTVRTGTATYTATNVCADTPELGTVTFTFVDTSGELPDRSFTFTSTNIDTVTCELVVEGCVVRVTGTGVVANEGTFSFLASFQDSPDLINDFIVFTIEGFAVTSGLIMPLPSGSVIAQGCQ